MQDFFEFRLGARVFYKIGLAQEIGYEVERLGQKRALIVADRGVIEAGLLAPVQENLSTSIECVGVFADVPTNSSVQAVEAGAALARECNADLVVAIGGGSCLDTAKCMRILITCGGRLLDYQGYNVLHQPLVPMVAIPTTAGTGSEVTPFAVIHDERERIKLTFVSPFLVPELAVLDPQLTCTLPPQLTAATAMDALTHAIETFVSTDNNPISDSLALHAIESISNHLRDAMNNGTNIIARGQLLIAACMAGMAFSNSFLGVVHALAHATGGRFPIHHGIANAIFLLPGMQFNSVLVPDRYVRIGHALGVNAGGRSQVEVIVDCINAVRTLMIDCGLPTRLRDVGVPETALEELADIALTDAAIFNNPRPLAREDLLLLLQAAW